MMACQACCCYYARRCLRFFFCSYYCTMKHLYAINCTSSASTWGVVYLLNHIGVLMRWVALWLLRLIRTFCCRTSARTQSNSKPPFCLSRTLSGLSNSVALTNPRNSQCAGCSNEWLTFSADPQAHICWAERPSFHWRTTPAFDWPRFRTATHHENFCTPLRAQWEWHRHSHARVRVCN